MVLKRLLVFLSIVGLGVFCFTLSIRNCSCLRIPLEMFSSFGTPIIKAQIESIPYLLEIDLGMARQLRLNSKFIEKIKKKNKKSNVISGDVLGNFYNIQSFQIPSIRLKSWEIQDITVSEEDSSYTTDTVFWISSEDKKKQLLDEDAKFRQGSLGWGFFSRFACFFDFVHREIFIGKNMDALFGSGCSVAGFIQVPFSVNEGGIILNITTDLGVYPFLLDTGATYSLIKQDLIDREKIERTKSNIEEYTTSSLLFNGKDLGRWTFRLLKISDLYHQFDGVLGMDFFRKHAICLDFQNKIAYVQSKAIPFVIQESSVR